jgi:GMP synthase (glutamine-hydrolysing)
VLVVEHEAACPPGFVGAWLSAEGVDLDVCRPYAGAALPADLRGYAGLVVLGGEMGANDDVEHPWLAPVKALIRDAVARGTPAWGICLGHQLMTVALGGEVVANPNGRTVGLTDIGWEPGSVHDPLCAGVAPDAVAVHWNHDIAHRLPDGAEVLATGPDGSVQIARLGERAWGVQFHPEAGPEIVAGWARRAQERRPEDDRAPRALGAIRAHEARLRRSWQPMAKAFAAQLG